MKVEVVIVGKNAYLEVEGKKVAVLYKITTVSKGMGKIYLSTDNDFTATVFNAKVKDLNQLTLKLKKA